MTREITADDVIRLLGLQPHPAEGGFFAESYRSEEQIPRAALPSRYPADRLISTAIYFLITPDSFSAMHRLRSDELFHFYLGDPVELLQLHSDGSGHISQLGSDLAAGMRPQLLVPQGTWQGLRLRDGGAWALMGTTVAPGFEYADFELGSRADLTAAYPQFVAQITQLTRM